MVIDENYLRSVFKIHKDVGDARLTPYIALAARRLKAWIGESNYNAQDEDLQTILKLAEGNLAMAFLIRNLNTAIRPNGLVLTEQTEGNVTLTYLNPAQTTQTEQAYFEQAESIVRDLMQTSDLPSAPGFIEADLSCGEFYQ